ncbi:hypothetical protein CHUAL_001398 [Chamberlinius hualienensis]
MWPLLLDLSKDECRKLLRTRELEAYAAVISAFRAQGDLTKDKRKCLMDLSTHLGISQERHKAEVRRAVNDEKLTTVADQISGSSVASEWVLEGKRLVPLLPRLVPQTAFTFVADNAATVIGAQNALLPSPSVTSKSNSSSNDHGNAQKISEELSKSQFNSQNVPPEISSESESLPSKNGDLPNNTFAKSLQHSQEKELLEVSSIATSVISTGAPSTKSDSQTNEKLGRRKRASSVDIQGVPAKFAAISSSTKGPSIPSMSGSRTVNIPLGGAPVQLTLSGSSQKLSSPASSSASTPQKVILVSTSCSSLSSSLLQRTVGVPIVKTVNTTSTTTSLQQSQSYSKTTAVIVPVTTHCGSIMATSNLAAGSVCTFSGGASPKLTVSTSATTVSASKLAGRQRVKQGILVPVVTQASSTSSSKTIQLKPGGKPSFHIKEGAGIKFIAQSVPVTSGTKLLTKSPGGSSSGSPIVVVTKTASLNSGGSQGTRVVNVLSTQAGGKVLSPSSLTLNKSSSGGPTFVTVGPKGKQAALVKVSQNMSLSSTGSKSNVIVVQKAHMLQHKQEGSSNILSFTTSTSQKSNLPSVIHDNKTKVAKVSFEVTKSTTLAGTPRTASDDKPLPTKDDASDVKSTVLADLLKDAGILPVTFEETVDVVDRPLSGVQNNSSQVCELNDRQPVRSTGGNDSSTAIEKTAASSEDSIVQAENSSNVVNDNVQAVAEPIVAFSLPTKSLDAITVMTVPGDNLNEVDKNTKAVAISEGAAIAVASDSDQGELDPSTGEFYSTKIQGVNLINSDLGATALGCNEQSQNRIPVGSINVLEETDNSIKRSLDSSIIVANDEEANVSTTHSSEVDVVGDDLDSSVAKSDDSTVVQRDQIVDIDPILITENSEAIEDNVIHETVMCEEVPFGDTAVQMEDMMEVTIEDMASEVVETSETQVVDQNIEIESTDVATEVPTEDALAITAKVVDTDLFAKDDEAVDTAVLTSEPDSLVDNDSTDAHVSLQTETDSGDEGISTNALIEREDIVGGSSLSAASGAQDESNTPTKRKRKPVTQVYSGGNLPHLSGWARSAMGLLLKVMKFRGTRRMKGEAGACHWFLQPVTDDEAPGYSQIVKFPMDFSTIKKRLETQFYEEISEFHRDMILVKHNCELYNPPDHEARLDCDEVFCFYQQEYDRLTEKWLKTHLMSPQRKKKT